MKLINIDQSLLQKYYNMEKTVIVSKLMPYKNNSYIKVYSFDEGEPLGDIPEEYVNEYLEKESEVFFLKQEFNDETGLFEFVLETLL